MHSLHRAQLALQRLSSLSTPPSTTLRMVELVLEPEPSLKDLTALVRTDPGLALEMLRRRPAAERRRRFALHVPNAVHSLGIEPLRETALRSPIDGPIQLLDAPEGAACTLNSNQHAVACATAALALARATHYAEPETAYAGGLLCSVGWLALRQLHERELREVIARGIGQDVARFLELEREVVGLDHENLAVVLADAWGVPYELHDVLSALHRSPAQVEQMAENGADVQLATLVRAAAYAAHEAGFPMVAGLRIDGPPADVERLLESLDLADVLEAVAEGVGRAAEIARPKARTPEDLAAVLATLNGQLRSRLVHVDQRLRAEESVNSVLHYGLKRLGDGDPLPGVMVCAMESVGFTRIACLEVDVAASKIEVQRSYAASGVTKIPERTWVPFPTDRTWLNLPTIVRRTDPEAAHQLVLELCGVSSAVVAPLQEMDDGKRLLLCADRGQTGLALVAGEERAFGIIANQASLLMKFDRMSRDAERRATLDPLTGAATRRRLMDRLENLIVQNERTGLPFSLAIMDLDHFKRFNDTMGHQTGDRLLQDLVKLLGSNVRKGDLVARYGGEEFVVLLPNCDIEHALTVAGELRRLVYEYGSAQLESYRGLQVSISMGVAQWQRGETSLALIGRADAALYEAKHAGRNCVMRAASAEAA